MTSRSDGVWIQDELAKADFGDLRLNKRFQVLAAELASKPSQPINQASTDWAATKAAYRFFKNSKATPEKILSPHVESTQLRAASYERIIVVQDTSVLDFTRHPKTTGLGSIGKTANGFEPQGLLLHSALAFSEKGLPLGLLYQRVWPRNHKKEKNRYLRTLIPVANKESFKWFLGLRELLKKKNKNEVIMVCDREADIYELLEECLTEGVDFVIRVKHARMLYDEELGDISLFERLEEAKTKGKIILEIPSSGKRSSRVAELKIKFLPVTYAGKPRGLNIKQVIGRHDLELYAVYLFEESPPPDEAAISWTLITSLPVTTLPMALEVVRFYKMRWNIELYFKCLKTGCNIEDCRLSTGDRLMRFISLQSIIAWRILWMTFLNRIEPDVSCEVVLTESEWKTLWLKKHRRQIKSGELKPKPPDKPPSTKDALRWIAMIGGFLGRKNDGEPGLITLWRGWIELNSAVELYEVLN